MSQVEVHLTGGASFTVPASTRHDYIVKGCKPKSQRDPNDDPFYVPDGSAQLRAPVVLDTDPLDLPVAHGKQLVIDFDDETDRFADIEDYIAKLNASRPDVSVALKIAPHGRG